MQLLNHAIKTGPTVLQVHVHENQTDLLCERLDVIEVDMGITQCVDKVTWL